MNCTNCGAILNEHDAFCPKCGQRVEHEPEIKICAQCGAVLHEGAEFCHKCGNRIVVSNARTMRGARAAVTEDPDEEESVYEMKRGPRRIYEDDTDDFDDEYEDDYPEDEYDEYDDEYDDEFDDDEEDEESPIVKKIAILLGIVILLVAAVIGFMVYSKGEKHSKNSDDTTETVEESASEEDGDQNDADADDQQTLTVTTDINIRKGPSKSEDKIGTAHQGDTFTYTEKVDGWYHIELSDGTDGYVYSEYVTVND